jgi:hypothetical protein
LDNSGDYLFVGKTDSDGDTVYNYNAISLYLNAEMSGTSYTYWFANVANTNINATRAVMLKMVTSIYFVSGTLTYTLSSLEVKNV